MQKTVTFQNRETRWNHFNDTFECSVVFSVIDSALIGTPREKASTHNIMFVASNNLMSDWHLVRAIEDQAFTEDMIKVTLQSLEDHLTNLLKSGLLTQRDLPPLSLNTQNSPNSCPYKLSNIQYPNKTSFVVDIDEQLGVSDIPSGHPNIKVLLDRMDDALNRGDYSGVLHASASTFETMAKDIVGIPGVQNEPLAGFFARYRKDSLLPAEILDYILATYELRNTTPLAGHGSTQPPSINRETAIALSEMTKAFVRIEYKVRQK